MVAAGGSHKSKPAARLYRTNCVRRRIVKWLLGSSLIVLPQTVKWEARPAATARMGEKQGVQMANGRDRPMQIVIVGDGPKVAEMSVLKLEFDGHAVTVLTREQAECEPHTMRVADILYLDVGSLSPSGVAMHRTLRQRRETKNVPIVLLAVRRAQETLSTALHLAVRDFLIASETVGGERSARASFA